MPARTTLALASALGVMSMLGTAGAQQKPAPVNDAALDDSWWQARSEFGADDTVGAVQRIDEQDVLRAAKLIKQGKTATLGKLYTGDIPFVGSRGWRLTIPGTPSGGPFGTDGLVFHDELVLADLGQVSTQFDGPGHIGVHTSKGDLFYGKRHRDDVYTRGPVNNVLGMGVIGTQAVADHAFVCRGVLLNAAKYRGMERLPVPDGPDSPGVINAQDVQAMIQQQGLQPIEEGDCVFLYTGHGDLWGSAEWPTLSAEQKRERVAQFNKGEPGFSIDACEFLAEQKIVLLGADTFAVEALPPPDPNQANPCHVNMQPRRGIWFLENMEYTQLLQDNVSEFMFAWAPLKMVGATGSPGNPVAIY